MNYDIMDTIVRTAIDAMRNAYVEHGSIATGACLLAADGTLYSGCAIDSVVPEYKLPAEVVVMAKAISEGKREFDAISVVADIDGTYMPDELSHKFLLEFNVKEIILADLKGNTKIMKLEEFMPYKSRRK
ncbi:MAG: cytidine deaminase [Selenomonadaceae bacterium]|nr:cytidine deaminase [Quinella sp. 1Q5]MBQ3433943.1 cytidine deaminase [Selenomonadaceae bacterium]MBQ6758558.1 cytidine deaminase [Selenomonadaceae bacterium]MBR0103549.1 cytidine deaminase [Selenomonadaceae bacterium]